MSRVRVGLIGAGSMGALHARTIARSNEATLAWVHDRNPLVGRAVAERFDSQFVPEPVFGDVDAVVVAAPTDFHHSIGCQVLDAGVPLLMEKPLANRLDEVLDVLAAAERNGVPLVCGLLERFNPAVRTAFDLCHEPQHFRSVRHSPAAHRITTDVAGDLLIHDVDLAIRLFNTPPDVVMGMSDTVPGATPGTAEISEALLRFGPFTVASLSASRRSQRKIRSMMITDHDRLIEVDLLRQDVTIYRHVLESASDDDNGYRQQTIIDIPVLKHLGEPLMLQFEHFLGLIRGEGDTDAERATVLPPHEVIDQVLTRGTSAS